MYICSKSIRAALGRLVDPLGIDVSERTPREELLKLIAALRPLEVPMIRIGPAGDGGYPIPDDLGGIRYAFSPGVSTESGFEADLAEPSTVRRRRTRTCFHEEIPGLHLG